MVPYSFGVQVCHTGPLGPGGLCRWLEPKSGCPLGPSDQGLHYLPVGEACGGCLGFWDFCRKCFNMCFI